jgi:hypothetical protein
MLPEQTDSTNELEIPDEYTCPLTLELMRDPVMSKYGNSFERSAILKWVALGNANCPLTRRPLNLSDIVTNHHLRSQIRQFERANGMDVTIIMTPDWNEYVGYFFIPDKDLDETERSEEDDEDIVEVPTPPQPDSRGNRILRTVRNRTGLGSNARQGSSSSNRQREGEPRRLMGLFQPRNSGAARSA